MSIFDAFSLRKFGGIVNLAEVYINLVEVYIDLVEI